MSTQLPLLDWAIPKSVDMALMHPDEIYAVSDATLFSYLGENEKYDRKSAKIEPKDLAENLSAFGNHPSTEGGVVAIGIANDKTIEGCSHFGEEKIAELMRMGADRCPDGKFSVRKLPAVNSKGDRDFIILARIYYVEDRLVELTDRSAYVRYTNRNKVLNEFAKDEIRMNKGEVSFEKRPCGLIYPTAFTAHLIRKFVAKVREEHGASTEKSDEQILELYHLGKRDGGNFIPNNACALLFAQDPRAIFPGSYIHFIRYEGTDAKTGREINKVKDRQYDGTLFDMIKEAAEMLQSQLREFTRFTDDGKFVTAEEYPRDAWYELIVNACVHRSYHIRNAPTFVKVFDDELRVESPGGFMPQVTPENIYEIHRPRNPVIMRVLREFGEVLCLNEGTSRIRREMQKLGLPDPIFREVQSDHSTVRATLRNDIINRKNSLDTEAYQEIGQMLALTLDDNDKKIVNYLIEHQKINVSQVMRITNISRWGTASEKLENLRLRKILDRHNSRKSRGASWYYLAHVGDKETKRKR